MNNEIILSDITLNATKWMKQTSSKYFLLQGVYDNAQFLNIRFNLKSWLKYDLIAGRACIIGNTHFCILLNAQPSFIWKENVRII